MTKYFIDASGRVVGECVVDSPANPDELLIVQGAALPEPVADYVWQDNAMVYSPLEPAVVIPPAVSKAQGVLALYQAGYWAAFENWLNTEATEAERLGFQMITAFERASPLLEKGRVALGLTVEQVDNLFILAATIKV